MRMFPIAAAAALLMLASYTVDAAEAHCTLHYNIAGGGAFYKHSTGSGEVTCSNGQRLAVDIESKAGGLTFGHSSIVDGVGKFTGVTDIHDVIGGYATGEADAGAGNASKAQVVTKGSISLALSGTGKGNTLGVSFGSFILTARK